MLDYFSHEYYVALRALRPANRNLRFNRLLMNGSISQINSTPATQFTDLAPHYDELMQVVSYDSWAEYIELLFETAEMKPKTILDCACGTGNVSFELAARNYIVSGVDISAGMIERAQSKLKIKQNALPSTPLPRQFVQADLSDFDLNEKFEAATCLYDSFNYILEPEKLQAAFQCIGNHIRPGGVFVFDMNTPWAFEANLFTQRNLDPKKNLHYNWQSQYDANTRVCDVTMHFTRKTLDGTEKFSEVHRERAYTREEIEPMLIQSGWNLLKTYDAFTINQPHKRSERWYFLAQRIF